MGSRRVATHSAMVKERDTHGLQCTDHPTGGGAGNNNDRAYKEQRLDGEPNDRCLL